MENSKYCQVTSCVWGYRHEALGLALLILATILTIVSENAFGIVAMFIVGGLLLCCKQLKCCSCCCHTDDHCHTTDDVMCIEKTVKHTAKKK